MMKDRRDLSQLKQIPIVSVANRLGIKVFRSKAMCFMGHDKATPSLTFNIKKNNWKCYGACGKFGDVISLVMEVHQVNFVDAVEWLANEFGAGGHIMRVGHSPRIISHHSLNRVSDQQNPIEPPSDFLGDNELYSWFINNCSLVSSEKGIKYLENHCISEEVAIKYSLRELTNPHRAYTQLISKWGETRVYRSGIAWGKNSKPQRLIWTSYAILFPFIESGEVSYIQGRMFEGQSKFLGLRGISKPLFNAEKLSKLSAGEVVHICEGIPDTLALLSEGLNALGVLGAKSFRPEWTKMLLKYDLVLLGDGDEAGRSFQLTISDLFRNLGKPVRRLILPPNMDVSDVLLNNRRGL